MKWLMVSLFVFSVNVQAVIETFEFENNVKRQLFQQLSEELRCPKCQNQNLSGSNAEIAQDLRNELYKMVVADQTTAQIKDFMVDRYGEFVLYKPRVNSLTYALWYGPFVLLFIGLIIVLTISKKKPSKAVLVEENIAAVPLQNAEHAQRLRVLMAKKDLADKEELDKS